MNLAPCPDCKKMISLAASACPNCGRPVTAEELSKQPQPRPSEAGQWGCIIVLIIIILLIIIGALNAPPRITDEDRMRQLEKMQQTGNSMNR